MPVTSQDLAFNQLQVVVRAAQTRLARYRDPEAPDWATEPTLAIQDLTEILGSIQITPEYTRLGPFVEDFLGMNFARQVTDTTRAVWCPQWWHHAEAMLRFGLLWEGYEHVRATGGPLEMSDYIQQHIGPHMRDLLDPDGPFKYCSPRHGHKNLLQPMLSSTTDRPADLFGEPAAAASVA